VCVREKEKERESVRVYVCGGGRGGGGILLIFCSLKIRKRCIELISAQAIVQGQRTKKLASAKSQPAG
jgi:hypothetical protein